MGMVEIRKHKDDFVVDGKVKASHDKIKECGSCFLGIDYDDYHSFYTLYGMRGNTIFSMASYVHFFKNTNYCIFSFPDSTKQHIVNISTGTISPHVFDNWACNGYQIIGWNATGNHYLINL